MTTQDTNLTNSKKQFAHQHPRQELLNKLIKIGDPVYIYGPTGSGKTVGACIASNSLEFPLYKKLMGAQMTESSILGYMDGHGKYVPGIAFEPFTKGGILLLDEIDNGNSNTNLVINGLADREINFPCGMFEAHENFRLVASANTIGTGANLNYVGRNRQDVALTARFNYLRWPLDMAFETAIVIEAYNKAGGKNLQELYSFYDDILRIRQAIDELNIQHVISPRNAVYMARLVANGLEDTIFNSVLRRGLDKDSMKQIINKAKNLTVKHHGQMAEEYKVKPNKSSIEELENKNPFDKSDNDSFNTESM